MKPIDIPPLDSDLPGIKSVLEFWFDTLEPKQWWRADTAVDDLIRDRFGDLHLQLRKGCGWPWRSGPEGRLAEIIVLDQFSRNIHRGTADAFSCDGMALALSQEAIAAGDDRQLNTDQRAFLYMPFMHSESRYIHELAVRLFDDLGSESQIKFERAHKELIDRFGRYPHRNDILGRASTSEESEYLASQENPGF